MSKSTKPTIVQQYGIRWQSGIVFSFGSREDAEAALRKDGRGVGVLVVHEGIPGRPADKWTPWQEA